MTGSSNLYWALGEDGADAVSAAPGAGNPKPKTLAPKPLNPKPYTKHNSFEEDGSLWGGDDCRRPQRLTLLSLSFELGLLLLLRLTRASTQPGRARLQGVAKSIKTVQGLGEVN